MIGRPLAEPRARLPGRGALLMRERFGNSSDCDTIAIPAVKIEAPSIGV
jgi:hypothetical protein